MTDSRLQLALLTVAVWSQGQGNGDRRHLMCQLGTAGFSFSYTIANKNNLKTLFTSLKLDIYEGSYRILKFGNVGSFCNEVIQ